MQIDEKQKISLVPYGFGFMTLPHWWRHHTDDVTTLMTSSTYTSSVSILYWSLILAN
jgi:hypothetical protein